MTVALGAQDLDQGLLARATSPYERTALRTDVSDLVTSKVAISGVSSKVVKEDSAGVVGMAPGRFGVGRSFRARLLIGRKSYQMVVILRILEELMYVADSLPEVGQT